MSDGKRLLLIFEAYKEKCDSAKAFVWKYIVILVLVVLAWAGISITITVTHRWSRILNKPFGVSCTVDMIDISNSVT